MRNIVIIFTVLVASTIFLSNMDNTTFAAPGNADNGKKLYFNDDLKCASCHGDEGKGDGKKGRKLDPKPTDFTLAETWLKRSESPLDPTARMFAAITKGGASVNEGKGMDSYSSLKPGEVDDIIEFLKTFKTK